MKTRISSFNRPIIALLLCLFPFLVQAESEDSFKLGVMLCLSGNCADWGTAALKGIQLAQEQLNKSGGVLSKKINLIVEDTAESISGARSTSAFRSLVERKLNYIIGPSWAPGALAIAPLIVNYQNILVITPSASSPDFSRSSDNIFNLRPLEDLSTRAVATFAFEHGKRRAAVFSSQQAAESRQGLVFEEQFKELGGSVSIRLEPDPTLRDLNTEALRIVASRPDVIFLISYNQMEIAARSLKKLNYQGMLVTISLDKSRLANAAGLLEGVIVGRAAEPSQQFKRQFQERYKEPPGLSAENGYDALKIIAETIDDANTFDVAVIKQRLASRSFKGAMGEFRFNPYREVIQEPIIQVVKNGILVDL